MAKTLTATTDIRLKWEHTNTPDSGGPTIKDHNTFTLADSLANGTGIDSADLLWHDVRALSATSSETIDLAGGITDQFGATVTFARIRGMIIRNQTTTANAVLDIGGASSNEWTGWVGAAGDIVKVGPDGVMMIWNPSAAGFAVTAGTGDVLKINNGSAVDITYQIVLIGSST